MATQDLRPRRYWVLSPNIGERQATVEIWRKETVKRRAAFMGYRRGHPQGRRFEDEIAPGDVILVARSHNNAPELTAIGKAKIWTRRGEFGDLPRAFGSAWKLTKRKDVRRIRLTGLRAPIEAVLKHPQTLVQLHPERNSDHAKVCNWLNKSLNLPPNVRARRVDYAYTTRAEVVRAVQREGRLVSAYMRWLIGQGRFAGEKKLQNLTCDLWEDQRRLLIEAKASISRENIRMACGQLFDYRYHFRSARPRKMAILLPKRPPDSRVEWLRKLGVGVIWQSGRIFRDNAGGRFTR